MPHDTAHSLLGGEYDLTLVSLSIVIAIFASFVSLELAGRIKTTTGNTRLTWLIGASTALGGGIWSMHFVAMLSFSMSIPITYEPFLTSASLLTAIGFTCAGMHIISQRGPTWPALLIAGTITGTGIAAMHYAGMAAMSMDARLEYDPALFISSVLIAIAASVAALWLSNAVANTAPQIGAALLMGFAIAGMHFTGMAAANFVPLESADPTLVSGFAREWLASSTASMTLLILSVGLYAASTDRRIAAKLEYESALLRVKEESGHHQLSLLQDAVDAMGDGFLLFNNDDRLIVENSTYRRLFNNNEESLGLNFEEIVRKAIAKGRFFPPSEIEPWIRARIQAHLNPLEDLLVHIGDRFVLVSERKTRSGGIVGIYTDVTRLKAAEVKAEKLAAVLNDANSRLRSLVDGSPLAIMSTDASGRILSWNSAAEATFGFSTAELLGQFAPLVPESDLPRFKENLKSVMSGGIIRNLVAWRRHKDGRLLEVEINIAPIFDAERQVIGTFGVFVDLTERRKAHRLEIEAEKLASIGQVVSGVAHEFNNLLGIVMGNLEVQSELIGSNPDAKELCDDALTAAARGAALVKGLIAYSQSQQFNPEAIDLTAALHNLEPLSKLASGGLIAVDFQLENGLWSVFADRKQMRVAIGNLATNARDAMPDGGRLVISCENETFDSDTASKLDLSAGAYVRIKVNDNGTGIPPDILPKVFEPFYTTKEVGGGVGLGLSEVQGFVKRAGGTIEITSELGRGTEVCIFLPAAQR